jgi:DNA ligase 1
MINGFKPLLAAPVDFGKLDFSKVLLASPKLDGIRAIVIDGVVVSRSLKPIPNLHVQKLFGRLEGLDGELIVGEANSPTVYRDTNSGVMSKDGEPDVRFYVFDSIANPGRPYIDRRNALVLDLRPVVPEDLLVLVSQVPVHTLDEIGAYETGLLAEGYEGIMLRSAQATYKFGRGTAKCNTLLKVKRMASDEATIVGFEEEMANGNEAVTNALGHTERSSHAENKVGKGRLGALVCQLASGVQFNIGTGFDHATRQDIWDRRADYLGLVVTFNHFPVGAKDLPRFPSYKGLRNPIDL